MEDSVVKQVCSENGELPGVTNTSICARIRHMIKNPHIQHERTAEVYSAYSSSKKCQIQSRRDHTLLTLQTQLRTWKYKALRAYKTFLDWPDPTCPLCNQESQNLQYWLQRCQATQKMRFNLFGKNSGGLDCLTKDPVHVWPWREEPSPRGNFKIFISSGKLYIY